MILTLDPTLEWDFLTYCDSGSNSDSSIKWNLKTAINELLIPRSGSVQ